MPKTHRPTHRLALLTALAAMLILVAAANVAAYPIDPDGEPLYLAPGQAQSAPAGGSVQSAPIAADVTSRTGDVVPIEYVSPDRTDRNDVVTAIGVALLAALTVLAAAHVVAGYRRRSAKAQ